MFKELIMKHFLILISLFVSVVSSAYAQSVDLLKASSRLHSRYGYEWQSTAFDIRVDNLAYDKQIDIYYRDADGEWKTQAAVFAGTIDGNQELWHAGWNRTISGPYEDNEPLDLEFVVRYRVNGQEYWDNNSGANYQLAANDGELLTTPVYKDYANAYAPYDYDYSGNQGHVNGAFSVGVLLQNLGYEKAVTIHYTLDNWQTVYQGQADFVPGRAIGYSWVTYPNPQGVEYWSFTAQGDEIQNATAEYIDYAISYTVNGVTYWDNNFGQNYRVAIH